QFNTSAGAKILPNRIFNYGRLQNTIRWVNNTLVGGSPVAKLYYYGGIPSHLISGIENDSVLASGIQASVIPVSAMASAFESTWDDSISFTSGPLQNQCFPLASASPIGEDEFGKYILFHVPSPIVLSSAFLSGDDAYDVQWFLVNKQDTGLIGDATDGVTDGDPFLITNSGVVTDRLRSFNHTHNGSAVPVAYPSLANARNYMNSNENSHYVYLTYQAMEEGKWNVYLRQLRLSEYDKSSQITGANPTTLVPISELSVNEIVYRIICTTDSCTEISDTEFILKRTILMEVMHQDGRDILNKQYGDADGDWGNLCDENYTTPQEPVFGSPEFPKRKVFARLAHSAVASACPDQFGLDEVFFQWQVGEEYLVPATNVITDSVLLNLLSRENDTSVGEGMFSPATAVGKVNVTSASVGAVWFHHIDVADSWHVMSDEPLSVLEEFKGFDIGEPILLTPDSLSHSMRPVIHVNYNNDVYVVYESISDGIPQIEMVGTAQPSSSLPTGIINAIDLDMSLNYFLSPSDFSFRQTIASTTGRLEQSPDMFIDLNDVVHIVWQSNRDEDWEIYYANSMDSFINKRLTKHTGRSLSPKINGDDIGNIFTVWHDDRFGN
ncbi:MAG: hypothetical protein KAH23_04090, partial [Kiritimatiellae bacterium]|nr:hypothetical protein [Kiritimatiellia bacterium]